MSLNERNQSAWCFSHNVRYLREKKGLTQEELAADSGVSVNEISKVERRLVIPCLNMVDHIANAFGLPAGRMLDPYLDRQAEFPREGAILRDMIAELEELPEREREYLCGQIRSALCFFREWSKRENADSKWIF